MYRMNDRGTSCIHTVFPCIVVNVAGRLDFTQTFMVLSKDIVDSFSLCLSHSCSYISRHIKGVRGTVVYTLTIFSA